MLLPGTWDGPHQKGEAQASSPAQSLLIYPLTVTAPEREVEGRPSEMACLILRTVSVRTLLPPFS